MRHNVSYNRKQIISKLKQKKKHFIKTCFQGLKQIVQLIDNFCKENSKLVQAALDQTRPDCVEQILHRQVKSLQFKALKWACSNYFSIFSQEWLKQAQKVSGDPLELCKTYKKVGKKYILLLVYKSSTYQNPGQESSTERQRIVNFFGLKSILTYHFKTHTIQRFYEQISPGQ